MLHMKKTKKNKKKGEKPGFQTWCNSRTHVSSVSTAYVSFIKKSLDWPGPNRHPILNYPMLWKKNETGKASDISYIRDYNFFVSAKFTQKVCNLALLNSPLVSTDSDRSVRHTEGEISRYMTWCVRTSKSSNECRRSVSVLGQTPMSKLIIPV